MIRMDINFPQRAIRAYPPPMICADFAFQGRYLQSGEDKIQIDGLSFSAYILDNTNQNPKRLISQQFQTIHPVTMSPGEERSFQLRIPLNRDIIRFIEESREGLSGTGSLCFEFCIDFCYSKVMELQQSGTPVLLLTVRTSTQSTQRCEVSRDEWLNVLKTFGWDLFEVFEVPVKRFQRHDSLNAAIRHLQDAQDAFQRGDYEKTVLETRKAVETAAKVTSEEQAKITGEKQEDDFKKNWEKLLNQIFPDGINEPKKKMLDGIVGGLKHLRHQAGHGGNIDFRVLREDAEFILTTSISVFRYIGVILSNRT